MTRKSNKTSITFTSKSEWARHMLNNGFKVNEVKTISNDPVKRKEFNYPANESTGMDYSFIHGVAKRAGIKATGGVKEKAVKIEEGFVTIRTDNGGTVVVNRATGEVKKTGFKSTAPAPKVTAESTN